MKVSRNDPCPCGSGKKYKKCCLAKSPEEQREFSEFHILRLSRHFFEQQTFYKLSAASLMYSVLMTPEIAGVANQITKKLISRGREEAKEIESEDRPERLIEMMKPETDCINYELLLERLLQFHEHVTAVLLDRLKLENNDVFLELSVRYFNQLVDVNIWDELATIVKTTEHLYTRSLLCLLMGVKGPRELLPLVWEQYHVFKNESNQHHYEQGPLYGLYEYAHRFELMSS